MYGLGRRIAPDPRDRKWMLRKRAAAQVTAPKLYDRVFFRTGPPLNQGNTDTCVPHGWSLWMLSFPVYAKPAIVKPFDFYLPMQTIDEFPDTPPAGGTSVRAGARFMQAQGHLKNYVWIDDVDDSMRWMQAGLGVSVAGTTWLNSMFDPSPDNRLVVDTSSGIAGGHCYVLCGYDPAHVFQHEGITAPAFRMQNSWGANWGDHGRAWILKSDMQDLLDDYGELTVAVEDISDAR